MKQRPVLDLIWGTNAIAKAIDRTPRQTHYMLSKNELPAQKIGGRWCSTESALRARFSATIVREGA